MAAVSCESVLEKVAVEQTKASLPHLPLFSRQYHLNSSTTTPATGVRMDDYSEFSEVDFSSLVLPPNGDFPQVGICLVS